MVALGLESLAAMGDGHSENEPVAARLWSKTDAKGHMQCEKRHPLKCNKAHAEDL